MKTTTVLLISLLPMLAVPAYADDAEDTDFAIEICGGLSIIARDVMAARQQAEPMSKVLPMAIDRIETWASGHDFSADFRSTEAREIAGNMVEVAYLVRANPSSGEAYARLRREEVARFENEFFSGCYTEFTAEEE